MKTLDKYLMWAIAYIVAWSIAFFVAWIKFQIEPTVLEGCILAPGVVEMIACAFIQNGKKGTNNDEGTNTSEIDKP